MSRGRRLRAVLFHTLFVFCALTLIVALAATGASVVAILSVVVAVISYFILPFLPSTPEPVFVRRLSRRSFPRAPPHD
jgi:hypothetical protein